MRYIIFTFLFINIIAQSLYSDCNANKPSKSIYNKKVETQETNPIKIVAQSLLNIYRKFITTQDNRDCQFAPSCSKYSQEAYKLYNPVCASLMTFDRLLRCNPLAYKYYKCDKNGYLCDPVRKKK
jgi:putative component of membrane protein insertase Oxa1/YidC/SpoIIIJ protein YidD